MAQLNEERIEPRSGVPRQLVILLHGYGADATDLLPIGHELAQALSDTAFVAPHAPDFLPHDALGGRQWFPLFERDMREYRTGAEAAAPALTTFVRAELMRLSLAENCLAILGFSQGAMMALQVGLRGGISPAALVAFSGLLPGATDLSNIQTTTPVLLVHGEEDDVVDPNHLFGASTALRHIGVDCEAHLLDAVGHNISARGIELAASFLKRAFAGAKG